MRYYDVKFGNFVEGTGTYSTRVRQLTMKNLIHVIM